MQRSACALNSSPPQRRGSIWPLASMRTRLACDRGAAASWRSARKLGHIRVVGSSDRQVPQPWQLEAVSTSVKPGQRRAGSITGTASGPSGSGSTIAGSTR